MLADPLAAWPDEYDSLDAAVRTIATVGTVALELCDWYQRERDRVASSHGVEHKSVVQTPAGPRTVTTQGWRDARAQLLYEALGRLEQVARACHVITYTGIAQGPPDVAGYRADPRPIRLIDEATDSVEDVASSGAAAGVVLPLRLAMPSALDVTGLAAVVSAPVDALVVLSSVTTKHGQPWLHPRPEQPVPAAAVPVWDVTGYASDHAILAATAEGFATLAAMPGLGRSRAGLSAQAVAHRAVSDTYWRAGGHAATDYLAPVAADQRVVAALTSDGEIMPLIAGAPAVDEAAARITAALQAGGVARTGLVEGKDTAFSWTPGLPPSIARYLTPAAAEGKSYDLAIFNQGVAVPGPVAEKAAKPLVGTVTERTVSLAKFAGIVGISQETAMYTANISSAIYQVLSTFCLQGFEAAAVAELAAQASIDVSAATVPAGFFDAQSRIMAAGGQADLLVINPANYAALMSDQGGGGYANFLDPSAGPTSTLFGAAVHVSNAVAAGKFYVLDRRAVLAIEHVSSPIVIADPYSKLGTNEIQLAVELFAVPAAVNPGAIAEVTITP